LRHSVEPCSISLDVNCRRLSWLGHLTRLPSDPADGPKPVKKC